MFTAALPVFVTETICEPFFPTTTLPKLTLAGVTWIAAGGRELLLALVIPAQPFRRIGAAPTAHSSAQCCNNLSIFEKA